MLENIYTSGEYAAKHPTWDTEHSSWKAKQIMRMMARNNIVPKTLCEVGCGAGEILKQLQEKMDSDCTFWGYEISPQAFELCKDRANEKLHFKLADIKQEKDIIFDVILLMDVIEHLEDYFSFLREIKAKSRYKILHIPLELALISVLNDSLLIKAREDYGHIHHFTQKIALQMLKDLGYEVIDNFYTDTADLNFKNIKDPIRKLFFAIHKDLAVRVFGRWSLLVLAK
jgi:Methyltransferase domain